MKPTLLLFAVTVLLAGCAGQITDKSHSSQDQPINDIKSGPLSTSLTIASYKRDVAKHISSTSAAHVYTGQPQALLRSVVVVRYSVDANGRVLGSEIMRSNRDKSTEKTALQSLRNASPLPRPAPHLLRNGKLENVETWLFNNDGRFQLRTIAEPQMNR